MNTDVVLFSVWVVNLCRYNDIHAAGNSRLDTSLIRRSCPGFSLAAVTMRGNAADSLLHMYYICVSGERREFGLGRRRELLHQWLPRLLVRCGESLPQHVILHTRRRPYYVLVQQRCQWCFICVEFSDRSIADSINNGAAGTVSANYFTCPS